MSEGLEGFGHRLREARRVAGWTQQQLADVSGITPNTIYLYEKGTRLPHYEGLAALCQALHLSPAWMMYGVEDPFPNDSSASRLFDPADPEGSVPRLMMAFLALNREDQRALATIIYNLVTTRLSAEDRELLFQVADDAAHRFHEAAGDQMDMVGQELDEAWRERLGSDEDPEQ